MWVVVIGQKTYTISRYCSPKSIPPRVKVKATSFGGIRSHGKTYLPVSGCLIVVPLPSVPKIGSCSCALVKRLVITSHEIDLHVQVRRITWFFRQYVLRNCQRKEIDAPRIDNDLQIVEPRDRLATRFQPV